MDRQISKLPGDGPCSGTSVTGTMQDSLTGQPVARGWAVLESGVQLAPTQIYSFTSTKISTSDSQGAFHLCVPSAAKASALVLLALDSAGRSYPPFVAPVAGAADFGTISMGGCNSLCGFQGQQQTSTPAVIQGSITTAPIAETGTVAAQYAINALDGSKGIWNLDLSIPQSDASGIFTTAAGKCDGAAPFCANYSFLVPSQKPSERVSGGYRQAAGAPTYSVYAAVNSPSLRRQAFGLTVYQKDGASPLTASPGARLSAADIGFTECQ